MSAASAKRHYLATHGPKRALRPSHLRSSAKALEPLSCDVCSGKGADGFLLAGLLARPRRQGQKSERTAASFEHVGCEALLRC
jgi:hypothetical protein